MAKDKILIVDDEKDLVKLLRYNLEQQGYDVVAAADGEVAVQLFRREKPALIVLDVMMPKLDGLAVCRIVRQESETPILMLTAKKEEFDRVLGLELGADDYLVKPFSIRELMARVKTILRRARGTSAKSESQRFGMLSVDWARYSVTVKDKAVELSAKEFEFLKVLVEANGKALTRDQLLERVWGYDRSFEIDTRTIDQHIARLRDKLGPEAERIVTVKKVGYRFNP